MIWFSFIKTDGGSAGHFVWLYGFQVSEWKYLIDFITGLVLLGTERGELDAEMKLPRHLRGPEPEYIFLQS